MLTIQSHHLSQASRHLLAGLLRVLTVFVESGECGATFVSGLDEMDELMALLTRDDDHEEDDDDDDDRRPRVWEMVEGWEWPLASALKGRLLAVLPGGGAAAAAGAGV